MPEDEELRREIVDPESEGDLLKNVGTNVFYNRFIDGIGQMQDTEGEIETGLSRSRVSASEAGRLYADRIAEGQVADARRRTADRELIQGAFREAQEAGKEVPKTLQQAWESIERQYRKLDEEESR
jgi:hypothetical protein